MKAIQYDEFGDYDRLRLVDLPDPVPADGELVIRMELAGVSPLDDTIRAGHLPFSKPMPIVPGGGGVGRVVDAAGSGFAEGQRVLVFGGGMGLARDGTWRQSVTVSPEHLIALPDGVSDETVLGMSTGGGYLTAYLTLTELVPLRPGQTVLAPGIGGAVGMGGVQVAAQLGAGKAISTASRTDKAEQGRREGHDVIDLSQESLRDGVKRLTDGRGVDIVIDGVGGPVTGEALGCLAPGGHLMSVGYSGGTKATIDVTDLIWRTAHVHGFMFNLFSTETIRAANEALLDLLVDGRLAPVVARRFPLGQAAEAQRHLIEDRPYGRVVLSAQEA